MEREWGLCGLPRTMEFDSGATGSITRALLAPCPSLFHRFLLIDVLGQTLEREGFG